MNRREHYLEAERLLEWTLEFQLTLEDKNLTPTAFESARMTIQTAIAKAQVHATLASCDRDVLTESKDVPPPAQGKKGDPCPSWILIDGGDDRAFCEHQVGNHVLHFRSGVGYWNDSDHKRAVASLEED